ncbi:MAG: NTPase [Acidobacteria bacterium]|jgi:hypothetical protein|nr:NTPase [Acidobacteriota bacterium]
MWTDNETKTDLIGFKIHADLIRSVVTDENLLPVVLGVFGDWGGGKSSIMQMLQQDLEDEQYKDVVCLYFNGWMFEGYEDAKTALLSSILIQLGEHERFGERAKDSVVGLLKRVNYAGVAKAGGKIGARFGLPLLMTYLFGDATPGIITAVAGNMMTAGSSSDEEVDKGKADKDDLVNWSELIKESKEKSDLLEVRKFRDDFEKLLKETKIKSLVILIDDLDRCLPESIIETLEAIKLFVLVPRTAFVIGADPRIVRHAIGTRYVRRQIGNDEVSKEEVEELTKDYLEKLIQIPYHLPRLSPAEIETYINLLACQKFLDEDKNKCVINDWAIRRKQNFYSSYQLGAIKEVLGEEKLSKELLQQLTWSNAIAQVVTEGLKGNPRQVKRMLNAMLLRRKLAEVAGIKIKDDVLAKLMVLEYSNEYRFKDLSDWQTVEEGKPEKLKKLEEIALKIKGAKPIEKEDNLSDWQTTSLEKWLQMQPSLRNVDLRDYFWLMRDRTSSTLVGVNMVAPIVRRLFDSLVSDNAGEQELATREAQTLIEPDRESLLGLLQQQIKSHPDEVVGYDALTKLAKNKVERAGIVLLKVTREVSADEIPAAVASKIEMIGKIDEKLTDEGQKLLDLYIKKHPQSKIGKAAALGRKD